MIKRIKRVIAENRNYHELNLTWQQENYFAHRYHDSIKGIIETQNLSLNIGNWAGNYSFFYLLNRILLSYNFSNIFEFGLGESTKLINAYRSSNRINCGHTIIEEDMRWLEFFKSNNKLKHDAKLLYNASETIQINGYDVNTYGNLKHSDLNNNNSFYLIDGPKGSPHFSRYDIVRIVEEFDENTEFLIMLDDYNRNGEQETVIELIKMLKHKNIEFKTQVYKASRSQFVITTKEYEFACSF